MRRGWCNANSRTYPCEIGESGVCYGRQRRLACRGPRPWRKYPCTHTQWYKLIHATVCRLVGRTILRDADSTRLMTMTTGFHWRPTTEEWIFLWSRAWLNEEIKKKETKRIREIVIRFSVCRFPDMTDRKHFHFRPTDLRRRVKFRGSYATSYSVVFPYGNFRLNLNIQAFTRGILLLFFIFNSVINAGDVNT